MTPNKPAEPRPAPADVAGFLGAVFAPRDVVLVRPVETWTEGGRKCSRVLYQATRHQQAGFLGTAAPWQSLLDIAERNQANLFFGVCPRVGGKGRYDLTWQIRTVRVLWADLDHCTIEEALKRCEAAGLPRPSVVIDSGNGVHLYWLLAEPYLIDDAGEPPAVLTEWIDQGPDRKKLARKYVREGDRRIYLYLANGKTPNPECPWGELSPKARHVQDVLAGVAAKIGGDHTQDLARLLRLPGTLNRKDERNGKAPVPCVLVECEPLRRYPLAVFEPFATASPDRQRREAVAKMRLKKPRKPGPKAQDRLDTLINACAAAEPGQRSERDWHLLCWCVEHGIYREQLWGMVQGVGKFAERGRDYFDRTLARAENHTQQRLYDQAQRRAAGKGPARNGSTPPPGEPPRMGATTPRGRPT